MGCDIHPYIEIREAGKWRPMTAPERLAALPEPWLVERYREQAAQARAGAAVVGNWREPRFAIAAYERHLKEWAEGVEQDYDAEKDATGEYPYIKCKMLGPDLDRNYDLFSMLADVRNGHGFAGCETGEGFEPLADPRGIPEDASPAMRAKAAEYGADGHSHSWATLAELQAYFSKERGTRRIGFVDMPEYLRFKEDGKPNSWSGGVSGQLVQIVTPAKMDLISRGKVKADTGKNVYTKISWPVSYTGAAGDFYTKTMPGMAKLGAPEDVRLVFYFDN